MAVYKRETTRTCTVLVPQLELKVTVYVPIVFFDLIVKVATPPLATVCEPPGET